LSSSSSLSLPKSATSRSARDKQPTAYLLPPFDEYTVAYKDRSAVLDPQHAKQANSGNGIFYPTIMIDGQVVGTWKRTLEKGLVRVTPTLFTSTSLKKMEERGRG
jgi:hypothetical protein